MFNTGIFNMARGDTDDAESSLLLIEEAGTSEEMESLFQKRRKLSTSISETSYKRCPIIAQIEYRSPLIHLGKINSGSSSSTNLDESIVVIHEKIHSSPLKALALPRSENEQPVSQDDSIIILSENEDESTNKSSKIAGQEPTKFATVRSTVSKLTPASSRSRVRAETATKKTPLRRKQPLVKKMQSISIDSEDENTNSDKDPSKSQSQAEVVGIDKNDISVPNDATKENKEDVDNSSTSLESAAPSLATTDDVLVVWMATEDLCTPEEQLEALNAAAQISKRKNCSVLCTDRKGNTNSLYSITAKSKLARKSSRRKKKRQNPNWASFLKNGSAAREFVKKQNRELNQPEASIVGRYYTQERLVNVPGSLRSIVIDGCSIAMSYTNGKIFSEDGLKLVIDYFKLRGHMVKAFVPQHKRSVKHQLLEKLYLDGTVVFTPSRRIGQKMISSHDDRYILDYATMCDGIVVSLDQYRDLYEEEPKWKNTIENRLLVPTFVGSCVMFPEDPLGRNGPKLEAFLRH